jgi:hypothetical protein
MKKEKEEKERKHLHTLFCEDPNDEEKKSCVFQGIQPKIEIRKLQSEKGGFCVRKKFWS